MSVKTEIAWCDSTWSPIRARVKLDATAIALEKGYTSLVQIAERMASRVGQHCEHVSPGCEHCYAETNNHRCLPGNGTGLPYDRRSRDLVEVFVDEKALLQPLKWKAAIDPCPLCGEIRKCSRTGGCPGPSAWRPRRIFVENQSDLFGEWITDEMLDRVFAAMALCPGSIFQVLTKRPERMLAYLTSGPVGMEWKGNDGTGEPCTRLDAWINEALQIPGINDKRGLAFQDNWPLPNVWLGVSAENQKAADERIPLLLRTPAAVRFISAEPLIEAISFSKVIMGDGDHLGPNTLFNDGEDAGIDWVICGGESGPGARPMHPMWARSLRDQCIAAGVPFFFKQWGQWGPTPAEPKAAAMDRVGKKAAGALLDGREWKQFPEGVEI